MTRSLRLRLLIATSLSIAVVLTLLGFAIYFSVRRSLYTEFDRSLMGQARALAATAEQHGSTIRLEFEPKQMPEFLAHDNPEYFQAWLEDGTTAARSISLSSGDLAAPKNASAPLVGDILLPNGRRGRSLTLPFVPHIDPDDPHPANSQPLRPTVIAVARETSSLHHSLEFLRTLLVSLFAAAIVISGAVLNTVVMRAIEPVKQLVRAIEKMRETDLSQRFSAERVPSELAAIPDRLNDLLERLESAFMRERAFTADVAHELRTPLAGIQTTLEVCRSRPRSSDEYNSAIDATHRISLQMQSMVESLLLLARADAGQLHLNRAPFDLCALVDECWLSVEERAADRKLTLTRSMSPDCMITSDRAKVRILVQNLLDNAVTYANRAGWVYIACRREGSSAILEISNSGSQIPAEQVPNLCRRFWRGDAARSDVGFHHGLGLSLCDRLINILGGAITIESMMGDTFKVRVQLT